MLYEKGSNRNLGMIQVEEEMSINIASRELKLSGLAVEQLEEKNMVINENIEKCLSTTACTCGSWRPLLMSW